MADVLDSLVRGYMYNTGMLQSGLKEIVEGVNQAKMRDTGRAFIEAGDYSPEGIQTFAKQNKVSPHEMAGIVQMASAFENYRNERDPLIPFKQVDESGVESVGYKRRSELAGGMTQVSPAKTETLYDKTTGQPIKVTQGQDIPANAVSEDWFWKQKNYDQAERMQNEDMKARNELLKARISSGGGNEETVTEQTGRAKALAQTLGWKEDGYDKDGNPLPDKLTYYKQLILKGTPDQKELAKAAYKLEYSLAGVKMEEGEGKNQRQLNIFTGKTDTTKNDDTGEDMVIRETKDGKWVTEINGTLYAVEPDKKKVAAKSTKPAATRLQPEQKTTVQPVDQQQNKQPGLFSLPTLEELKRLYPGEVDKLKRMNVQFHGNVQPEMVFPVGNAEIY